MINMYIRTDTNVCTYVRIQTGKRGDTVLLNTIMISLRLSEVRIGANEWLSRIGIVRVQTRDVTDVRQENRHI